MPTTPELTLLRTRILSLSQEQRTKFYNQIARASRTYNFYCYQLELGHATFFRALTLFFRLLNQESISFIEGNCESAKIFCLILAIKLEEDNTAENAVKNIRGQFDFSCDFVAQGEMELLKKLKFNPYQGRSIYDTYVNECYNFVGR